MIKSGMQPGPRVPSPKFNYRPLSDPYKDIRLVSVLGERHENRVQVQLYNTRTDAEVAAMHKNYRCLSYVWGMPEFTNEILLNGQPFSVRHNLYEFLERAAQTHLLEPLWIDALCIDQDSINEKNAQVPRMGRIYRSSREVLVWLGNDAALFPAARFAIGCASKIPQPNVEAELAGSMAAFWNHPYWTRTWITQELLVASSIQSLIGPYSFDWTLLQSNLASSMIVASEVRPSQARTLCRFVSQQMRQQDPLHTHSLWRLLTWRGRTECSVRSDRIYALCALVQEGYSFFVRYQERLEDLFWRAVSHFHAWPCVERMVELRDALQLSNQDIARGTRSQEPERLSFDHRVHFHGEAEEEEGRCPLCRKRNVKNHYTDIVFCALGEPKTVSDFSHVVIHKLRDDCVVTIVPGSGVPEYKLSLEAVVYQSNKGWVPVRGLEHLEKTLRSRKTQKWAVRLPCEYVIHCLKAYDTHDSGA